MEKVGFYQKVRQELTLRNDSPKTIKSYLSCLRLFIRHFHTRPPEHQDDRDLHPRE